VWLTIGFTLQVKKSLECCENNRSTKLISIKKVSQTFDVYRDEKADAQQGGINEKWKGLMSSSEVILRFVINDENGFH